MSDSIKQVGSGLIPPHHSAHPRGRSTLGLVVQNANLILASRPMHQMLLDNRGPRDKKQHSREIGILFIVTASGHGGVNTLHGPFVRVKHSLLSRNFQWGKGGAPSG